MTLKACDQRAVISGSAVKYWERKAGINPNCRAVKRIVKALGIVGLMMFPLNYARAGDVVLPNEIKSGRNLTLK